MTYYIQHWLDDEYTEITKEELAIRVATATARGVFVEVEEVNDTEMYFTEFELND